MASRELLDFDSGGVHDLDPAVITPALRAAILRCIEVQKESARAAIAAFRPHAESAREVSAERLDEILARGDTVHGIASDRSISNVIPFLASHIAGAVDDPVVAALRRDVDREMSPLVRSCFRDRRNLTVVGSGHFWYPPGSYMGWHTNSRAPGWRVYVSHAETAGRSFLRYRDPDTGAIVTLHDDAWNVRLFRITRDAPLWHAVHADTHRFSMGYRVIRETPSTRVLRRVRRLLRR